MNNTYLYIVQKSDIEQEIKNKIILNLEYNFKKPLIEVKHIYDVLLCFWWHESSEGFDFWNKFYKDLYSELSGH